MESSSTPLPYSRKRFDRRLVEKLNGGRKRLKKCCGRIDVGSSCLSEVRKFTIRNAAFIFIKNLVFIMKSLSAKTVNFTVP